MTQKTKPIHSTLRAFRVERKSIAKIRFILEAYEGVAFVETIDPKAALVMLHIAPGCEDIADQVMSELAREFFIEPAEPVNTRLKHEAVTFYET
ncbi:MAG: DUF4911 domain-containing protein [Deltaproteobacteria bacterium]|nr:DUF4911 domain-containing protein [Deltaproteobacteria bacterium]